MASIKLIRILIDKYFEGQTSLNEEKMLQRYFRQKNIPAALEVYRPMFQYFTLERKARRRRRPSLLQMWLPVSSAAAVFLFFVIKLALTTPENLSADSRVYIDGKRYTDVELIQTEALKALEYFSENDPDVYVSQVEALDFFCNNN
jgi:hypothetical protein